MLEANRNACVVILDGCSIREIPKMMELSQISHRPVAECGVWFSAIPRATDFAITIPPWGLESHGGFDSLAPPWTDGINGVSHEKES